MSAYTKSYELRKQSKAELEKHLADLKQELASLRVQKVASGSASKIAQIGHVRKAIARTLTIISQTQRAELKQTLGKAKYLPKDMRAKKTRALRRQLTKEEQKLVTERTHKRQIHFAKRVYAIKA